MGLKLISGSSNLPLAQGVAQYLDTKLVPTRLSRFADGEFNIKVEDSVRNQQVFIIQSLSSPVADHLMELCLLAGALEGTTDNINAVIPYYGTARQDRKAEPRTPITAKWVASVLDTSNIRHSIIFDLHNISIQGFFTRSPDHLVSNAIFARDIEQHYDPHNLVIVAPDTGAAPRARSLAKLFGIQTEIAIIDKRRVPGIANVSEVMNVVGGVEGKRCIIYDDIVDTAGTLCNAAQALTDHGAEFVDAYITHGIFSHPAEDRIRHSKLGSLVTTDSISVPNGIKALIAENRVRYLSIVPLLGEVIRCVHEGNSISHLITEGTKIDRIYQEYENNNR